MRVVDALRTVSPVREVIRRTRTLFWRTWYRLPNVDPTFLLSHRCSISRDFVAGPHGFMNVGCTICPRVAVGRYVMFGPDVMITGADHLFEEAGTPIVFSGRPDLPTTTIGDDVWIGARSIILAGVSIGRGCIIAAGSVVTRDQPEFSIVAGVPARVLRARFANAESERIHRRMLDGPTIHGRYCDPKDGD